MSRVFVDTSAIYGLLVESDSAHAAARQAFERLRAGETVLVTTSYVLVETYALLASRVGRSGVEAMRDGFAPLLRVVWIDEALHERALDLLLAGPRDLTLVDTASFVVAREMQVDAVFAFDRHFEETGFTLVE